MWAELSFVLLQSTRLTDKQTDGRTDRQTDRQKGLRNTVHLGDVFLVSLVAVIYSVFQ